MGRLGPVLAGLVVSIAALAFAVPASAAGLAYTTGGATSTPWVWVANGNGSDAHKLVHGDDPKLSPNGGFVAFSAYGETGATEIYTVGGTLVDKVPDSSPVAWSPDSRYVAIERSVGTGTSSKLVVFDTNTKQAQTLVQGQLYGVSFAPSGADRLVFGLAHSQSFNAPANLYTINVNGTGKTQLTHNGKSDEPIWGSRGIVFDEFTARGTNAPVDQLFELSSGHIRQITHSHPGLLVSGLAPLAISAGGTRAVAVYGGTDTAEAYTVNLSTGATRRLVDKGHPNLYVSPDSISANGKRALVVLGGFEQAPSAGSIATIPFGGGSATVFVKHAADPSWDQ